MIREKLFNAARMSNIANDRTKRKKKVFITAKAFAWAWKTSFQVIYEFAKLEECARQPTGECKKGILNDFQAFNANPFPFLVESEAKIDRLEKFLFIHKPARESNKYK